MGSVIDLSLEDIIKRKKQTRSNTGKGNQVKNVISKSPKFQPRWPPVKATGVDARNKIISKKRIQLTDARDRLAQLAKQKDARLKLEQIRQNKMISRAGRNNNRNFNYNEVRQPRAVQNDRIGIMSKSNQVRTQPMYSAREIGKPNIIKKFIENRCVEARPKGHSQRLKPILRTVENDIIMMDVDDYSMEKDYRRDRIQFQNRNASLNFKITTRNSNALLREDPTVERSYRSRARVERSPPRLTSILKKTPVAARKEPKLIKHEIPVNRPTEYRIIVSNLRSSVTGGDIEELFGDVGNMQESRLVRPGTAEVIYKSLDDAQCAVDLYHNRQLDGQPMNCLLVTPRAQTSSVRSNIKHSLPQSTSSNVEPDISTFHKVMFSEI